MRIGPGGCTTNYNWLIQIAGIVVIVLLSRFLPDLISFAKGLL